MALRFTLKDLFLTTTLLATGIAAFGWGIAFGSDWLAAVSCISGCVLIGAGIFAPFRRIWLGIILGLVAPVLLILLSQLWE